MPDPGHDAPAPTPLFRIDAGWLFVIAGAAVLAATLLIPAFDDLDEARWQRDRALAIEQHRIARLERYGAYLAAVDRGDESVLLSLATTQLNQVPDGLAAEDDGQDPALRSASPFNDLEPDPLVVEPRRRPDSLLFRLATGEHSRLWMLVGGAVCVLFGILPPATRPK